MYVCMNVYKYLFVYVCICVIFVCAVGGTSVVIKGSSFGGSGAMVTIGGNTCVISAQDHDQITCSSPAGQGVGNAVIVRCWFFFF